MDKPRKKEFKKGKGFISLTDREFGYNKACEDWEAYHRQEIGIALDHIERLEKQGELDIGLVADILNDTVLYVYQPIGTRGQVEADRKAIRLKDFRVKAKYILTIAKAIVKAFDEGRLV